jgi:glucan phosphoethanolaminetransferase (alkaline phosphatase superfamily)
MKKQSSTIISRSVMGQIKNGSVQMKPKLYYSLLGIASAGTVILSAIVTAYLSSIAFYWVRIQTANTMAYGARANLSESLASFPWWVVLLAAALLVATVTLVRHQGRMYKHTTASIAILLTVCSLLLGFVFSIFDIGNSHVPNTFEKNTQGPGWQRNR